MFGKEWRDIIIERQQLSKDILFIPYMKIVTVMFYQYVKQQYASFRMLPLWFDVQLSEKPTKKTKDVQPQSADKVDATAAKTAASPIPGMDTGMLKAKIVFRLISFYLMMVHS